MRFPYRAGDQLLWRACVVAHARKPAEALSLLEEAAGRGARFHHTHFCLDPRHDHPPLSFFMD